LTINVVGKRARATQGDGHHPESQLQTQMNNIITNMVPYKQRSMRRLVLKSLGPRINYFLSAKYTIKQLGVPPNFSLFKAVLI
jgi:hypothetical protein